MPNKLTLLTTPRLVPRPPVGEGRGVLVVVVELEISELGELTMEETGEGSPELDGVGDDIVVVVVVVMDIEDDIKESPKVEVGGEVEVMEGREGMEVGLFKQTSDGPALTVITGVSLPSPLESPRAITTLVPAGIVTILQVNEVPVMLVKAAAMGPSALPVWKDWKRCRNLRSRTRLSGYSQG